ncbi:uncharacterized protein [Drosophila tropicalis]|uniref:uncharacterized protein n=1 Tax=Drosophila tropicalis TaxID=46794 RepID=UPI0035ABF39E
MTPPQDEKNFYLPHHAVFKPDSTTTKVRRVFNTTSTRGVSLSDVLHTRRTLQADLTLQVIKWRFFQFVFNADITQMYRHMRVDPRHTPFQRILYRDRCCSIQDFELAIRVLLQLAQDVLSMYLRASKILPNYMYVDDVLAVPHSEDGARLSIQELQAAFQSAGLPLRKWTSNKKEVPQAIYIYLYCERTFTSWKTRALRQPWESAGKPPRTSSSSP